MLSKKNSMVTMVTDEFLENRIILQKSVATIGFIWFFWFQKCILLYIFAQVFLVMRSIRSHISLFRLGFTPTLTTYYRDQEDAWLHNFALFFFFFAINGVFTEFSQVMFFHFQLANFIKSLEKHVCSHSVQPWIAHLFAPITPQDLHWDAQKQMQIAVYWFIFSLINTLI